VINPPGKPSVQVLDFRPSDKVVPGVLTSGAEGVTLRFVRGDEAEMLIQEIIAVSDRMISFLGQDVGYVEEESF